MNVALKQPNATHGITVSLLEIEVDVVAEWERGFPGNREQPEEPAGWSVERVFFRGIDITDLVDTGQIESELNAGEWD